jgi:hypothetical protein
MPANPAPVNPVTFVSTSTLKLGLVSSGYYTLSTSISSSFWYATATLSWPSGFSGAPYAFVTNTHTAVNQDGFGQEVYDNTASSFNVIMIGLASGNEYFINALGLG